MKTMCSSCTCGNILIKGNLVSQCLHHDIQTKMSKTLFSIDFHSLQMRNFNRIARCLINETCSKVKCLICGTIFKFFYKNLHLYVEKTQIINNLCKKYQYCFNQQQLQSINRSVIILFANLFKPLALFNQNESKISFQNESNNQLKNSNFNDDDTDFEIMFSNKDEPLVGSYKQQNVTIPIEE